MCTACLSSYSLPGVITCPSCGKHTLGGVVCSACQPTSYLSHHLAMAPYVSDDLLGRCIEMAKYQYVEAAFQRLDAHIATFLQQHGGYIVDVDQIIPVPLHRRRYVERGFNQATLLAQMIATHTALPILDTTLVRHRATQQQAQLGRADRKKNVAGAFEVCKQAAIEGTHILLVDDVYTTGSTMQACAEALLAAGAKEVRGWSLARG